MNILVINGPNLNLLGIREPAVYGSRTYAELCQYVHQACKELGIACRICQSNHEGQIVDWIQAAYADGTDGIVINPAAYTHTSIAIPDALKAVGLPAVEVHLSDIATREAYRRVSYTTEACIRTICGKGFEGYRLAAECLREHVGKRAGGGIPC